MGLKFRRQCGIGVCIVDFYCPELKLAIEIDGDVHGYEIRRIQDVDREKSLQKLGIKVLRFTNGEVIESMSAVLEHILSNHPLPPSLSKEGETGGAAPDPEGENRGTAPDPEREEC
jgi:very-short-patch-repair endonuclease